MEVFICGYDQEYWNTKPLCCDSTNGVCLNELELVYFNLKVVYNLSGHDTGNPLIFTIVLYYPRQVLFWFLNDMPKM